MNEMRIGCWLVARGCRGYWFLLHQSHIYLQLIGEEKSEKKDLSSQGRQQWKHNYLQLIGEEKSKKNTKLLDGGA
jgi:hypothetical protein